MYYSNEKKSFMEKTINIIEIENKNDSELAKLRISQQQ